MTKQLTTNALMDYIGENPDWQKFAVKVSENTGEHYVKLWMDNARANRERVLQAGWATECFQGKHEGKAVVMLGASPAVKAQIGQLRELSADPDFMLVGISSGLKFMLENGVKPDIVMIADADPAMTRYWDGLDMSLTKDTTLVSSVCVHPDTLDMWQGPVKYLAIYTSLEKLDRKIHKKYRPVNGSGQYFHSLGGQFNTGAAFAFLVLEAKTILFVGCEFGFAESDTSYYADGREDWKDKEFRGPHPDIYGKKAYTSFNLFNQKLILEDYLAKLSGAGWFFNCTEAGIFGVSARYGNLPWIQQLPLKTGIMQARWIMNTGQPLYSDGPILAVPDNGGYSNVRLL